MPALNNLPGIQINKVDRGLVVLQTPVADSTLIIATSGQGPANQPYQVTDRAQSAKTFGFQGGLIKAQEEAMSAGSDNVILFRMGTSAAVLTGVGQETGGSATPGFSISFGQITDTTATDYTIWYKTGVLSVYYQNILVFSNDPAQATDTGDIVITGTIAGNTGLALGTGASSTAANAITLQAAASLAGAAPAVAPTLTPAVTGVGLNGRQKFVAFLQAINLLQGFQVKQVVVPDATIDAPSVAFYVAADTTTANNNPATNPSALDWLKTTYDAYNEPTFQWASETTDSNGGAVTAMAAVTPAARITAGFREVSWGYALANFCASLSQLNFTSIGFIGASSPASYRLIDVRKWVGFLPTYDANGNAIVAGKGLAGLAYTVGTALSALNPLTTDFITGHRQPGFFQTVEGAYDGTVQLDINSNPIDIGAYLHIVADQAILSNGYASKYLTNLAAYAAGVVSMLDEKTALTNQPAAVTQLPALVYTPGQLDSLTQANINVLRSKGASAQPAFTHDKTAATAASDYTQLLRMRITGLAVATLLAIGDPFIGSSTLGGLQNTALKTALDTGLTELVKRGYMTNPVVSINTTAALNLLGKANLYLTFHPADQLVQLNAYVGFSS